MRSDRMKALLAAPLGICLLLAGCQSQIPAPAETAVFGSVTKTEGKAADNGASISVRWPEAEIPLSQVDFASYEEELSPEDWQALTTFFPVLKEGKTFLASLLPAAAAAPAAQEELSLDDLASYGSEDPPPSSRSVPLLCAISPETAKRN